MIENLKTIRRNLDSNSDKLLLLIINWILSIPSEKIDKKKSEIIKESHGYNFRLFSNNDAHCPIFIYVDFESTLDIQLNKGGEYIYLQKILSEKDFEWVSNSLSDLLESPIIETTKSRNGKLLKVSYTVTHNFSEGNRNQQYQIIFGNSLPWHKLDSNSKCYEQWG